MMNQSHEDLKNLHRFLDGEFDAAATAAFRARLAAAPELRRQLEAERAQREAFAAARQGVVVVPAGFTSDLLAAVRRLPSRDQLEQQEAGDRVVRLCRRLLLAAMFLFGLGLVWHSGMFDAQSDKLEAAPDEVHREMERLDALILEGAIERGGREHR
jgi:anti-sigma factor RsiW